MPGTPNSMRILLALDGERPVSAKEVYRSLGLSTRAGNAALAMLRDAGWIEPGTNRWVRLSDIGVDAAAAHRRQRRN